MAKELQHVIDMLNIHLSNVLGKRTPSVARGLRTTLNVIHAFSNASWVVMHFLNVPSCVCRGIPIPAGLHNIIGWRGPSRTLENH